MKEIPYFRFTVSEWLQDDISLMSYGHKGFFIDFCSYYWFSDCKVDYEKASKRYANAKQMLDDLIKENIIKKSASGLLEISFLLKQHEKITGISVKRSNSGKLGGLQKVANAKQKLANAKQIPIYKDKDKEREIVGILNSILGSQYRENSKATVSHISARLAEGFTVENFRQVIQTKFDQWNNDPKMKSYLRPETLFGTKFESYLNEAKIKEPEKPKQKNFYILQEHDDYLKELGYEKYLEFMKSKGVIPMLNAQGDEV